MPPLTVQNENIKHMYSIPKPYTISLTVIDSKGKSAGDGISTRVIPEIIKKPALEITSFISTQASDTFPLVFADGFPAKCDGKLSARKCNYGRLSGEVVNVGDGIATDCKLQVNESRHITEDLVPVGTQIDSTRQLNDISLTPIDAGATQEFSLIIEFRFSGDYVYNGQVVCSNGFSDKIDATPNPLHVKLGK